MDRSCTEGNFDRPEEFLFVECFDCVTCLGLCGITYNIMNQDQ